jgi:hypothetical protein
VVRCVCLFVGGVSVSSADKWNGQLLCAPALHGEPDAPPQPVATLTMMVLIILTCCNGLGGRSMEKSCGLVLCCTLLLVLSAICTLGVQLLMTN